MAEGLVAGRRELVAMACEVGCEPLVVVAGDPVGGFVADRQVGIRDVPSEPVQLDGLCSFAPPATPVRIVGRCAEGREQVPRRGVVVDVGVLVSEVGQLSGELAVLPLGRRDGLGVGERLELGVDLRELTLEERELGALPFEVAGGLLARGTTARSSETTAERCEAGLAVCDGCCEALDVCCELLTPCGQLTQMVDVGVG